ncbi:MAG: hypothetical protein COW42_04290, partial [Deltaproteobacteria bacterium CG17_big_fil_post_rev_8_21_14_2_50_63_7]
SLNSRANCGACGASCTNNESCVDGVCTAGQCPYDSCNNNVCTDTNWDPLNCGGCNRRCNEDEVCIDGNCETTRIAEGCTDCASCSFCTNQWLCCDPGPASSVPICVQDALLCPRLP